MMFIILELAVSAMVLWAYDRSRLEALGFLPTPSRLTGFAFGFVTSSMLASGYLLLTALLSDTTLSRNEEFTIGSFLSSTYWMLKSVMTEELLFRGALLIIAVKQFGLKNACLVSAAAFGIYHWFTYGIVGDVQQMTNVFILTAVMGLLLAYAFMTTRSLYLPVGLHLGWNMVSVIVFSQGPLGDQLFVPRGGQPLGGVWSVVFFMYQVTLLPFATFLYLRKNEKTGFNA